ncbi:MAG: hypothetical protein HYW26_03670 [Candidatus Aenigmarchaeota archaeon]|nr:hypothetical protein [Candidatus Aenigmarchaeota archaeon]
MRGKNIAGSVAAWLVVSAPFMMLIPVVLASGCTSGQAINIKIFCEPSWEKQGIFVLDDAQGWENCRSYCVNKYGTRGHKVVREGVGASCFCDANKCS